MDWRSTTLTRALDCHTCKQTLLSLTVRVDDGSVLIAAEVSILPVGLVGGVMFGR